jgi:hypothetical protein
MSSPRHRKQPAVVAYDRDRFATPQEALLAAARAQGCTCNPVITIDDNDNATARHDDWCALLRRQDTN